MAIHDRDDALNNFSLFSEAMLIELTFEPLYV
jgi:hypothetical protein